jgi:benzoyl-CoA reductase subunit D
MNTIRVAGVDVGSSSVKSVLFELGKGGQHLLSKRIDRIRRRDLKSVIAMNFDGLLAQTDLKTDELDYIASTGEGEMVTFRTGHFFGMTTHARGAIYFTPEARSVIDLGALHTRAMVVDGRSKVLRSGMTSQCASGSGQFLENISRYLGVTLQEISALSMQADAPERVSAICAVLAETDVINMVSRGISTANILKGVHLSMGDRIVKLLRSVKAASPLAVTGGLACDRGLIEVLKELFQEAGESIDILVHEEAVFAGAVGAALWGGFRYNKLRGNLYETR